ncbi:hypothetical protein [Bacteroides sp. GM023]|uniref:hypothetical protein n=1 Tax=Bacteroides sp. GM023 TaxID=2723058 RepID=UPI00168ACF68|nr:hypothetical protein [Bacteroides sp. GM023]MBD3588694.1 hypothetical protein [Bacteroides sp. GM023]
MKTNLFKIYLTIIALIGGCCGDISGQQMPSFILEPTVYSPQTSAMIRYDEMPVNMSTGRIDFNIPLVNIEDRDFDFPISLFYNSDGFKPTEADNYVGRGWALRCGGMIYRQVRGIPDDLSDYHIFVPILEGAGNDYSFEGFMSLVGKGRFDMNEMRNNITRNPYQYAHGKDDYAPLPTIPNTNVESAADMYFFNFGKHSGRFMINFDGTVTARGYDGHRYEVDLSDYEMAKGVYAHSTVIRIKTDDGYVYTFGGDSYGPVEYSAASWEEAQPALGYDAYHKHAITAWYLTEIKAPNGRKLCIYYKDIAEKYHKSINQLLDIGFLPESEWQDIALLYSLTGRAAYRTSKPMGLLDPPGELYDKKANSYFYSLNKVALIDYITIGDAYRVDFHYSLKKKYTEQHFVGSGFYRFRGAQLDSISVSHDGEERQNHSFTYSYQCANRLFLSGLNHSQKGKFQFSYKIPDINVLPTTSNIDHWGYWTGGSTEKDIMPGTRYASNVISYDVKLTTTLRDPSPANCDATLLQSVVYPTGGKSTFEYQPHKYSYCFVQDAINYYNIEKRYVPGGEAITGGARIWKVKFHDEDPKIPVREIHYRYADSSGMEGILTYMPLYRCWGVYNYADFMLGDTYEDSDGFGRQFNPSQHILYPEVSEYYIDPKQSMNEEESPYKTTRFYTEMHFADYTDFFYNTYTQAEFHPVVCILPGSISAPYFLVNRFRWPGRSESYKNGKVLGEYYYDDKHALKKSVNYVYKDVYPEDYSLCIYRESLHPGTHYGVYTHVNKEYFGMYLLFEKQVTEYDDNFRVLTKKELYKYDDCGYLKEQTFLLPEGDSLITSFKYLEKMPSYVTDKTQVVRNSGKTKNIQCEHFDYFMQEGRGKEWPVLSSYYSGTDKQHLEKRIVYIKYDRNGNPVHIEKDGKSYLYIWGYDGRYLTAKIENATYEELMEALDGNSPENISGQSDYLVFADEVEGLRERLPRAMVTNYTYIPNVGVSSETSPNGQTIYYEYDTKGRLEKSYRIGESGKQEILQLNEYHLINE